MSISLRRRPKAPLKIVVVGGGHNGLAAAIVLADAGHRVVVVERNDTVGGAARTEEVTLPGFRHDLMATNLNLFAGSPFFAEYGARLTEHGFAMSASTRPVMSLFPDGRGVGLSTDLDETLEMIRSISSDAPGDDALAFAAMRGEFDQIAPYLFPLLGSAVPSTAAARQLAKATRALGRHRVRRMARLVAQSPREFAEEHFGSPEVCAMFAAWGMHLDFAPSVSGGALFPFLETMASQANGMVIGTGGVSTLITSMVGLFESLGGEVRTGTDAESVQIEGGKATGVVAGGEVIPADRVVATLAPGQLFRRLVGTDHLDESFVEQVDAYRFGPGTVMVHLALDGQVPWSNVGARESMYVHIGPYMADMDLAYQQAQAGLIPARPTLVVGQPTVVDPSRAPDGKHVLWVQARMYPAEIAGDGGGEIATTDWDEARDAVADRIMSQLEPYAPGLGALVLGRSVLSPLDIARLDVNLVGGDSLAGSHHLMQNFTMRPFPGWSRYKTPIDGLFMCGASTWPGAGLGAGSGYILGKQLAGR